MGSLVLLALLARGWVLGLSIAAPVGPIGALCIQRTLRFGRLVGFVTGLGAATADMLYGACAALGLTVVTRVLIGQRFWIHVIGGLLLLYLGARTLAGRAAQGTDEANGDMRLLGAYLTTLGLTLSNPLTILSFVAIFAGLDVTRGAQGVGVLCLIAGILLGSVSWWFALSGIVAVARTRLTARVTRAISVVCGVVIIGFGVLALLSLRA